MPQSWCMAGSWPLLSGRKVSTQQAICKVPITSSNCKVSWCCGAVQYLPQAKRVTTSGKGDCGNPWPSHHYMCLPRDDKACRALGEEERGVQLPSTPSSSKIEASTPTGSRKAAQPAMQPSRPPARRATRNIRTAQGTVTVPQPRVQRVKPPEPSISPVARHEESDCSQSELQPELVTSAGDCQQPATAQPHTQQSPTQHAQV